MSLKYGVCFDKTEQMERERKRDLLLDTDRQTTLCGKIHNLPAQDKVIININKNLDKYNVDLW